jgi:hypothetical protein
MRNTPRSTRASEISLTDHDSFVASVARSPSIPTTRSQSSSSSANRSRPSKEYRPHAYSSTKFSSRLSRSVSYKERRIQCSSKIRSKLKERQHPTAKVCILDRWSCRIASAQVNSTSLSAHALPIVHSKATKPFSRVIRVPSLVSSSLSRTTSWSCNSMAITNTVTASEGEGALHQSRSRD